MKIIVFGHDADDAMLARRIAAMEALGHHVAAYTMRRGPDRPRAWCNSDLGQTYDGQMGQRLMAIGRGIRRGPKQELITKADLLWARNLDMLLVARATRGLGRNLPPMVYEALDIHWSLSRRGPRGAALRAIERWAMKGVSGLVTSSPGFIRHYFEPMQPDHPPIHLLENRVPLDRLSPRPMVAPRTPGPLRLGFVGHLRCERSFQLLVDTAAKLEGKVQIHLHGRVSEDGIPDFHTRATAAPHLHYHGVYQSPDDLSPLYSGLDLVWAGDYLMAAESSAWSLVNRLYEGGYFGVPCIAPAGTETARWIEDHGTGLTLADPTPDSLGQLLLTLTEDSVLASLRRSVAAAPTSLFAEGNETLADILNRVVTGGGE